MTGLPAIITSEMSCLMPPNLPPWAQERKPWGWFPILVLVLQTSCCPTGPMEDRRPLISPLQQLTVAEAAVTPGHALEVCVSCKLSANIPSCRATGVECVPMVVEALGGWAPEAIGTIRRIGDFLGQRSHPLPPYARYQTPLRPSSHHPVARKFNPMASSVPFHRALE